MWGWMLINQFNPVPPIQGGYRVGHRLRIPAFALASKFVTLYIVYRTCLSPQLRRLRYPPRTVPLTSWRDVDEIVDRLTTIKKAKVGGVPREWMVDCPLCAYGRGTSQWQRSNMKHHLLRHLVVNDNESRYRCAQDNCRKSYSQMKNLRRHLREQHKLTV